MKKQKTSVLLIVTTLLLGLVGCKNVTPSPEVTEQSLATVAPPAEYPANEGYMPSADLGGEYFIYPEEEYLAPQEETVYPLEEATYPYPEESNDPYPVGAGETDADAYPGTGEMESYPYPQQDADPDQGPERDRGGESPSENPPTPDTTPVLVNPYVISTSTPIPILSPKGLRATDPAKVALVSGKVQLIEFFAFWSVTCKVIEPDITDLEQQYGERVNFIYLDVDDPAVKMFKEVLDYKISPHFFLLGPQGEVLDEWVDFISQDEIKSAIEKAIQ